MGESHDTNLPGAGAEELASRASRRAARLREDQAMGEGADVAVAEQLRQAERRLRTYSQGAEGERLVAQALGFLERYGWVSLHDVHWPGRPKANIDHIAVGPGGVVVIDAKNWTGEVAVRDGVLRQNGYSRERETTSAATATTAVAARLAAAHRSAVHPVLCLVAQDVEPVVLGQTTVVGRSALVEHLVSLPLRLSAYEVADVARFLATDLGGPRSPEVLTSADLATQTLARAGFTVRSEPARPTGRGRTGAGRPTPAPARTRAAGQPPRRRPSARKRDQRLRRTLVGGLVRLGMIVGLLVAVPHALEWWSDHGPTVVSTFLTPSTPEPALPAPVEPGPEPTG